MIKKILIVLILSVITAEASENIWINKEDFTYSQDQLKAYYIREKKIKPLEKKCKKNDIESCGVVAMEKYYNFHPCIEESKQIREEGLNMLLNLCNNNSAKACYSYATIYDNDFKKYQSLACKLDSQYCLKSNVISSYEKGMTYIENPLSSYQDLQKGLKILDNACIKNKDGDACRELSQLYENDYMFQYFFSLVKKNKEKAKYYQYYSCLYNFDDTSCRVQGECDFGPPILWIKERASKLDLSLLLSHWNPDNFHKTRFQNRDPLRYIDQEKGKKWQIGVDKKLYGFEFVQNMYLGKCIDCMPTDGDWRLPTRKEILSVIDLFEKKDFQYYWTSEQSKENPMDYWVVDVKNGTTHQAYKNNNYGKGCVYVEDLKSKQP